MKKYVIAGFVSAMMVAVASNAMAGQQTTAAALDNQLNWQMSRDFGGAHASARVRTDRAGEQQGADFQAVGVY